MSKKMEVNAGDRYGRLVVIKEVCPKTRASGLVRQFQCVCDCGEEVIAVLAEMRRGNTRSCGCLQKETAANTCLQRNKTHGESDSRTYRIWRGMKQRCLNPNTHNYEIYGGRSVSVCQEWQDSYEQFVADMGHCPEGDSSIERIDNDGDYEPGNCMWATRGQQSRNRRSTVMLTHNGKTMCMTDWAEEVGMPFMTLRNRIQVYGWTVEEALTTPVGQRGSRVIVFEGQSLRLSEWAERTGLPRYTISDRLKRGWSVERALTTPVRQMRKSEQ